VLLQHRDHLAGEQARLFAGERLDEQPARAGLVDDPLEGGDDLTGGAGDRDGRPVLAGGGAVDVFGGLPTLKRCGVAFQAAAPFAGYTCQRLKRRPTFWPTAKRSPS